MKSYTWWKSRKKRIRKKYTLFLGHYYSPKEINQLVKTVKGKKNDDE